MLIFDLDETLIHSLRQEDDDDYGQLYGALGKITPDFSVELYEPGYEDEPLL